MAGSFNQLNQKKRQNSKQQTSVLTNVDIDDHYSSA